MKLLSLNQRGSVFMTTVISAFLMSLVGGYAYQMTTQDLHFVHGLKNSTQAQQLAEAGLYRMISKLNADWDSNIGATWTDELATGSYSVGVDTIGGRYLITSTGTANGISRNATAEVEGGVGAIIASALDYAIAAGGNASVDSGTANSPGTVTGDVYSGGDTELDGPTNGGVLTIDGDVDAGGSIDPGSDTSVTGTQTEDFSSEVAFPEIDYEAYLATAQANSTYTNGDVTYTSGNMPAAPAGGVIYINGNLTIQGTQNSTACLVVTGNITINKSGNTYPQVTITAPANYPAIVNQGNFTFTSTGNGLTNHASLNVTGLLYTQGNFTFTSGNHDTLTITGSLVGSGNVTISPTADNTVNITHTDLGDLTGVGEDTGGEIIAFRVLSLNS